ncbi:MAG: M14 family metallopeptidase [Gammaproteobacteria bacterium]|nr:M14 family metallopeptidase [Gammaproteobacteria bacterium]
MVSRKKLLLLLILIAAPGAVTASDYKDLLPPLQNWQAGSLNLIVAQDDPWITPAERSGLTTTPRYDETVSWLKKLVRAAPELQMISIGRSDQGRDIWMIIASDNGAATAKKLPRNNPIMLVQAGIHSGEIDGKDAGMMLLRDMTVAAKRRELLENASLLFIPMINVDGHERFSAYGRINQRGPAEMGWRSNRRNLNLNRDYTKLETPGVRAVVKVINDWRPDLYIDVHVTDGIDYQYDVTWGYNGSHAWSPNIAGWLAGPLELATRKDLTARGHKPGPLIFSKNYVDYNAGISSWTASPRYSSGYGDVRHLPTVLIENHSLKPYIQRVLGTYVLLESMLDTLGQHGKALRKAIAADRKLQRNTVVLDWVEGASLFPEFMLLDGVSFSREYSAISGAEVVRWNGVAKEQSVAIIANDKPGITIKRPQRYYIPAEWSDIADKLRLHGIAVGKEKKSRKIDVQYYRLPEAKIADGVNPFEGRTRIEPGTVQREVSEMQIIPGDYYVETDQPLGTLATILLEPQSPDSLFQWGYFLEIMNRTEYFESYIIEPVAQRMMQDDPELAKKFQARLAADAAFAADPHARLHWFYEQTPFHDEEYRRYPIASSLK